jgi:hypothetical protein
MTISELRERLTNLDEEKEQIAVDLSATEDAAVMERRLQVARANLPTADWAEDPDAITPDEVLSLASSPEDRNRVYRCYTNPAH